MSSQSPVVEPSNVAVVIRRKADSAQVLRTILAKLKHLDLTGKIRFESAVMKTHGGYADVFIGYVDSEFEECVEVKVAIKRLRIHIQGDSDFAKSLSKEIRVWSRLKHPNVLAFLGYALEGEDYPLLVSEWMENGTAMTYVNENPECDITNMILGIAEGLAYLHSQGVIHADMKADNVLVSACGQPQICDFGISSILAASSTFGATSSHNYGTRGSLRWMAVEFFEITDPPVLHSEKSDVWAFGMTVYELLSKQIPYAQIKLEPQVLLTIMHGILPPRPESFSDLPDNEPRLQLWSICQACWRRDPASRPTMPTVASALSAVKAPENDGSVHLGEDPTDFTPQTQTNSDSGLNYPFRTDLVPEGHAHSFSNGSSWNFRIESIEQESYNEPVYVGDDPADLWLETQANSGSGSTHPFRTNSEGHTHIVNNSTISNSQIRLANAAQELSAESSDEMSSTNRPKLQSLRTAYGTGQEWGSGKPWGVRFELPSPTFSSPVSGSLMLPSSTNPSIYSLPIVDNVILKEGYLAEVTDDPVFRLYTTRYYVLGSSSLRYYRQLGGELIGTINVIGAQLPDESGRKRGYQNALLLITQRSMGLSDEASLRILYAESQSECKEWVLALQQMANHSDDDGAVGRSYSFPLGSASQEELGRQEGHVSEATVSVSAYLKQNGKPASQQSRLFSFFRRFTS